MNASRNQNRLGLTLIELLVALTLSSILLVAMFSLMVQLSKTRKAVETNHPFVPWRSNFAAQLQQDYRSCRSVLIREKELRLAGYGTYFDREGRQRDCPCEVRYFIWTNQEANWLFREYRNLLSNERRRELVCRHVSGFRSATDLATDVAPGVLTISISFSDGSMQSYSVDSNQVDQNPLPPMTVNLVRHGGFGL